MRSFAKKLSAVDVELVSQKEKPQQGGWGELEAGAFDLRDQYASRDRRYNERPATLVPLAFAQMSVLKRARFADG